MGHHHSHHHNHGFLKILGKNTELYFATISGIFWFSGISFSLFYNQFHIAIYLYIISALFGGIFTFYSAINGIIHGKFEIDFLMLFAAIGAAILGKWGESSLLLFLFSSGHALEHYAMRKARKSISALSDLAPPMALVRRNNIINEVRLEELKIGDIIVVRPNSKIAADGVVIKGNSHVDQAAITGESIPVNKHPHADWENINKIDKVSPAHRVFAGTINGNELLEIKVLREAKDSTLAKLIYLVKEAESQKSPTQRLTDKFEKYYVPIVLILVIFLHFAFLVINESFQDSFYRAMTVLIAASPCALAISTPSAVLAGIARAAKKGVLFKGGGPLEELGKIKSIAFDKTGTLTNGRPTLTHAIAFGTSTKEHLLKVAVAVEAQSDHPLAKAIVEGGLKELGDTKIPEAHHLNALTARGVKAVLNNQTVHIGNRRLFKELTGKPIPNKIDKKMNNLETNGHTAMIVHEGDEYLGIISVMDRPRPEAKKTIDKLNSMGIHKITMLTGDHHEVANAIAKDLGITDPLGSLLPEDKVDSIEKLKLNGEVAMLGDGVNDAPAMAKSSIGIAMGAVGSDVALETADIALMGDKLNMLPFAIGLSRKANQIIKQNLMISLGMVAILVPLSIFSIIPIGLTVVGHEGSTMIVVLNALRLLKYDA